ncbi:MAG TPA: ABC transporter permease [Tepidisphaeraceae bacterium]|jgi:simple sugar transport system permease protein
MTELVQTITARDRTRPAWARAVAAAVGPVGSVLLCVSIAAAVLAALPTAGESHYSFAQSLAIIGRTTWERVMLPRAPRMTEGYRNWILTLQSATPLLLTGLAVAVAFRANVLNIGGQGQYVAGAIATTAVAVYLPGPAGLLIPMHLLAAVLAGALVAAIAAVLQRWRDVPVVLSTLLLNFVALEFLRYLLQGPMRARRDDGSLMDPQSPELAAAARLPEFLGAGPSQGIHLGFFLAVASAILLSLLLRWTTFGFRLKVVGQNERAARFAGMNVGRVSFATLALSGAFAGLAGGIQVAGLAPYVLLPDLGTDGMGFTGIAVALLGRLSPVGVVFSALFFGMLNTAFRALERSPLEIHSVAAQAVQGALVIAVLVVTSPRWARMMRRVGPDSKLSAGL